MKIASPKSKATRRIKHVVLLTALVAVPLALQPFEDFRDNHAFLLNASPSLPNWAFWLDKRVKSRMAAIMPEARIKTVLIAVMPTSVLFAGPRY